MNGPIFEALKRTLKAKGLTYRDACRAHGRLRADGEAHLP